MSIKRDKKQKYWDKFRISVYLCYLTKIAIALSSIIKSRVKYSRCILYSIKEIYFSRDVTNRPRTFARRGWAGSRWPVCLYVMFNGLNDHCRASHPGLRSGLLVIARQLAGGGVVMQCCDAGAAGEDPSQYIRDETPGGCRDQCHQISHWFGIMRARSIGK